MPQRELVKRIFVAVIGIPVIIGLILYGRVLNLLLFCTIMVMCLWEFFGIIESKGVSPSKLLGIVFILLFNWDLYVLGGRLIPVFLFTTVLLVLTLELFNAKQNPLLNSATTLFGIIYCSLLSSFILIRELPKRMGHSYHEGGLIVLLVFFTIWICDSGAYLLGARFGKHALMKRVSPKKTWEGSISGFLLAIASAVGFCALLVPSLNLLDGFIIGAIVGTVGQIGDLVESLYKRDCGVKDSSDILPGHGGFLDRFDSALFVGPFVYLYLLLWGF